MTEAPERIWVEEVSGKWLDDSGVWGVGQYNDHDVEYIRADIKPKVKPLVWDAQHASTDIGLYTYYAGFPHQDGDTVVQLDCKIIGHTNGAEEAKAAAQADYESRILSALA